MKAFRKNCFWLVLCLAALTGCRKEQEEEWVPVRTTLEVGEDGSITETIMEKLDQAYYDAGELKSMIDSSVRSYAGEHGPQAVAVNECEIADGQVNLAMTYSTWEDYAAYNHVAFYNGSMLGAELEGYLFLGPFREVHKKDLTLSDVGSDEVLAHKEYQVLITDASHDIRVPGRIVYLSANAGIITGSVAGPAAAAGEEDVPVPDGRPASREESEKSWLYIVYDYTFG